MANKIRRDNQHNTTLTSKQLYMEYGFAVKSCRISIGHGCILCNNVHNLKICLLKFCEG